MQLEQQTKFEEELTRSEVDQQVLNPDQRFERNNSIESQPLDEQIDS